MKPRDFIKACASAGAILGALGRPTLASALSSRSPAPFPQVPGLTKYVADFIVNTKYSDIPADVVELGKKSILDGLGLALSGSKARTSDLLATYVRPFEVAKDGATVIGTSVKLPVRFAAFANGVAIHVDDFDDTQLASAKDRVYGLLVHPTVCVLPAALATAEVGGKTGKDLLVAYQAGVEVECKIAEAISPRHYEDGFHSTGTCGVFGGTAACAKLKGLDVVHTSRAFGVAASHAAGLREN